ncbi:MAG: oxygen-independent coproporphyrinogen III oxidase [Desulfobacterales bacterium]|jgi:oxygen-independent coproporphyrinogen-3 oxidase|nr:oxygen-independent coproporphyrinogen III oxidase [Desulfobacterales bacterium]
MDLTLIKKYDKPGPRYTSYPTAPQFSDTFTHQDFLKEIADTNRAANPPDLSLYFHLPFCDTLCYFCGCNMIVTRNRERIGHYVNYLKKEIDLIRPHLSPDRKVSQLHWGGGTPTHLTPDEISNLSAYIHTRFNFQDAVEASCEIDPRELTRNHLAALRAAGFNRISMGVQDFNEKVQKAVNRIQPENITRRAIAWVRELGFHSFNLDLMYGLPFQSVFSLEKTIDGVIDISPDRIALFNFAYVPWMKKHMRAIRQSDLPSPEEKLNILKMATEKLIAAGYVFIGMDHFAKPDDELAVALREKRLYRNFQGYSTHAGTDLYAMGITSISQFGRIYAQNVKTEAEYFAALDKGVPPTAKGIVLSDDDVLRRWVITRLMCDFELDFGAVEEKFGIHFETYFRWGLNNLREMTADHLLRIDNRKIIVLEMGRLLIRNIAMNFDGFIERQQDSAKYSRTV